MLTSVLKRLVAVLAFGGAVVGANAQVVAQGATPDSVTKALGAPRSRSATKTREIWMYPGYQVIFENGRVSSPVTLPSEGPPARKTSPAAPAPAAAPALQTGAGKSLELRAPERRHLPANPPPESLVRRFWRGLWPYLLSGALGALALAIGKWRFRVWRRRRAEQKLQAAAAQKAREAAEAEHRQTVAAAQSKAPSLTDWELTPDLLRALEWKRFELLVQRYYEAAGYRAKGSGVGADGGVDVYLFRAGAQRPCCAVQCKAWSSRLVDVKVARELFGVSAAERVPESVLATTGDFTPEARVFGRQNRMTLLSGSEFLIVFNRLAPMMRERILREITEGDYTTPSCPRCGVKLVRRTNAEERSEFWGCARYPRCRYTLSVRGEPEPVPATAAG